MPRVWVAGWGIELGLAGRNGDLQRQDCGDSRGQSGKGPLLLYTSLPSPAASQPPSPDCCWSSPCLRPCAEAAMVSPWCHCYRVNPATKPCNTLSQRTIGRHTCADSHRYTHSHTQTNTHTHTHTHTCMYTQAQTHTHCNMLSL